MLNEKELIYLLLDYYSQKNNSIKNNKYEKEDFESINEIINRFEDSNNKILQEIDTYIKTANKRFTNMDSRIKRIESEIIKHATNTTHTKEHSKTIETGKKTNNKSKRQNNRKEVMEKILDIIPEYSLEELENHKKEIIKKVKMHPDPTSLSAIANDGFCTAKKIRATLGITRVTTNNYLNELQNNNYISAYQLPAHKKSPKIYFKIKEEDGDVQEDKRITKLSPEDDLYKFNVGFNNPGYDLINGLYVKPRRGNGKSLHLNAEELYQLSKLVTDPFTVKAHNKLVIEMRNMGLVNDGTIEAYCFRLVHGFFGEVIENYINYQKKLINPDFRKFNGVLLINDKYEIDNGDVKDILDNIPYGDEKKIFNYSKDLIDKKYRNYPSEAIHIIIENSAMLNDMFHDKPDVENNPQKRREKGIL